MATKKYSLKPQGWHKGADEFDRKVNKSLKTLSKGISKELKRKPKISKQDKENIKNMSCTSWIIVLVIFFSIWLFLAIKLG